MKIQKLFNRFAFQTPISISILICFVGLYLCAYFGNIWILLVSALLSCAIAVCGHLWSRENFSAPDRSTVKLVLGACGLIAVSLASFAIRVLIEDGVRAVAVKTLIASLAFGALFALELRFLLRTVPKLYVPAPSKHSLKETLPILIVCGVVILLSLENFRA